MRTSIPDCSIPQISSFVNRQGLLFPGCPCSLQSSPLYNPAFLAGLPALHPATPFEKGVDPKTFCGWATYFLWRGEESGIPELLILGRRSMDTVRRPLCGCFVLSCMVGGIFRKPLGFRRCLPPARPEKALPFQAGRSPCTKHPQTVRLCLYAPKKVFEGSKGRFFKNAPWQGVGQGPTKGGRASHRGAPFQVGRSPCTKHPQDCPASPLHT